MKNLIFTAAAILFLGATTAMSSGCSPTEANAAERPQDTVPSLSEKPAAPASKPANVQVQTLEGRPLTRELFASGLTKSLNDITYSAEVAGRVDFLKLRAGDKVKKGQVLARIDFTALSAQSEQAQASLELARVTHERLNALSDEKLVSQQRIDEAKTALLQAEAATKIASSSLGKSTIRAMHEGVVAETYTDQGEFVGPGTPMLRIVDTKNIVVEARFAESEISLVREGAPATVHIEALGEEQPGTVETVVPTADPESKTFKVRIRVDNKDGRILVGMAARSRVTSGTSAMTLLVPHDAVIETGSTRKVFVADGKLARARAVVVGQSTGGEVAIVEGLSEGDKLIVVGQRDLKDEQPIIIVN